METNQLETLLERLTRGDTMAAQEVFLSYEPYLRMVVRRMLTSQLRSKFDSMDVVQSVWSDLLRGFREAGWRFATADHLKAFLIRATRNRFLNRQQKYQGGRIEESLDVGELGQQLPSKTPEPSATAHANELWEQLLNTCLPTHRPLVEMRRAGYSLKEIAADTGYHPSSVRRIFYDLARHAGQRLLTSEFENGKVVCR